MWWVGCSAWMAMEFRCEEWFTARREGGLVYLQEQTRAERSGAEVEECGSCLVFGVDGGLR